MPLINNRAHLGPEKALLYLNERHAGRLAADLPLSAIHLDIEYMDRYKVFTVDSEDFPDLPGLAAELAADDVRLVTIVDPGVARARCYRVYDEGLAGRTPGATL